MGWDETGIPGPGGVFKKKRDRDEFWETGMGPGSAFKSWDPKKGNKVPIPGLDSVHFRNLPLNVLCNRVRKLGNVTKMSSLSMTGDGFNPWRFSVTLFAFRRDI